MYKGVTYQLVPPSLLFSPQDYMPAHLSSLAMSDLILEAPGWMTEAFIWYLELSGVLPEEQVTTVLELEPSDLAEQYASQVPPMANWGSRIFATALQWCGEPPVDFRKQAREVGSTGSCGCNIGVPGSAGCFVCNIGVPGCFVFGVGGGGWGGAGLAMGLLSGVGPVCWTRVGVSSLAGVGPVLDAWRMPCTGWAWTLAGMDFGGGFGVCWTRWTGARRVSDWGRGACAGVGLCWIVLDWCWTVVGLV